ncbi:hypothetical protein QPK13_22795 [Photorhabdus tasmaniensis]
MILSASENKHEDDASMSAIKKEIYRNRMKVDGKVLIARFAIKQFFHSDFGDFIYEFEKKITECLSNAFQTIRAVKESFKRSEQYQYQRRVNDELVMHIELNADEYPANMPDQYIGFKETEVSTGVFRDDEKLVRIYTDVSSGIDVPVMMHIRFTSTGGGILCESSHGTYASRTAGGRVKICDRTELIREAFDELRDCV